MITKDKIYKKYFKGSIWVVSELEHLATIIDVLRREFPICDVAGGQFGKPFIFTKGNPQL